MQRKYYRLDYDRPRKGDRVHAYISLAVLEREVRGMRSSGLPPDPPGMRMRFWEITGVYAGPDVDGDPEAAQVIVHAAQEVTLRV